MRNLEKFIGIIMILLGIVLILDATRARTEIGGIVITGHSIDFFKNSQLQVAAGIAFILGGLLITVPQLREWALKIWNTK